MIYRGHVENGMVVLHDDVRLADGTEGNVEPVEAAASGGEPEIPTLCERFKDITGMATGLPADFAEQHDHYIHGTPKK